MKYLCLIYLQEAAMDALPQREWDALLDECVACTEALQRGVEQAREAARIARLRYEAGREGFQIVLDAERQLAAAEAARAQADAQLSTDLVALFLALGGGWR